MRGWRRTRGNEAETHVLRAARRWGWQCVARNFASRRGEIDLVLRDHDALVIVEVRYRTHANYGRAAESVTPDKQARIIAATQAYLCAHPQYAESTIRFDVVGVDPDGQLDWVSNAFQAE